MAGSDDNGCFTKPTEAMIKNSLGSKMIRQVDRARDLIVRLGLRTYAVKIVHTGWSGPYRGSGQEYVMREMDILPTPKIASLNGLNESLTAVGLDEVGSLQLTEISGRFSEAEVTGVLVNGTPLDTKGEQAYYEVSYLRSGTPIRRRFSVSSVPSYDPEEFQWTVRLERAREDREALTGDPQ